MSKKSQNNVLDLPGNQMQYLSAKYKNGESIARIRENEFLSCNPQHPVNQKPRKLTWPKQSLERSNVKLQELETCKYLQIPPSPRKPKNQKHLENSKSKQIELPRRPEHKITPSSKIKLRHGLRRSPGGAKIHRPREFQRERMMYVHLAFT